MALALVTLLSPEMSVPATGGQAGASQQEGQQEVRAFTRVLVELRVAEPGDTRAIADAQRRVLARLSEAGVTVVRRYTSVPLLALEVDAESLAQLARMGDLVTRVVEDSVSRTQKAR